MEPKEKIRLALRPLGTPQIPPPGISCLKGFLQQHGLVVKTVDASMEIVFNNSYNSYINLLQECIPEKSRGNFYNIGNDVLQNHLMTHIN